MGDTKEVKRITRIWSNLMLTDKLLIILDAAALIGAIITYTGRLNFVYFCLAFILFTFITLFRKFGREKHQIIKNIILFLISMVAVGWSIYFFLFSFPVDGVDEPHICNTLGEKQLQGMQGFERVSMPFRDGTLHGWLYRKSKEQEAPLLIFFNGAGECSADSMLKFSKVGNLMDYIPDYDLLCVDYPGYGDSPSLVYEASMISMVKNVYKKAITLKGIDKTRITVSGYSIGTGPAAYMAMKYDLASMILIATYDRAYRIGDADRAEWYQLIFGYRINPYDYAKKISEPVLILTSDADKTCQYKSAMRVANRLKDCKVVKLTGVQHWNMLCDESYQAMKEFLKE